MLNRIGIEEQIAAGLLVVVVIVVALAYFSESAGPGSGASSGELSAQARHVRRSRAVDERSVRWCAARVIRDICPLLACPLYPRKRTYIVPNHGSIIRREK